MRLRVLVASDNQNQGSWWERLWSRTRKPAPALPNPDARWDTHGTFRFIQRGRLASIRNRNWTSEYAFHVLGNGMLHEMRMLLREPTVDRWQKQWDQRMPEAARYALARAELVAALDSGDFSATRAIPPDSIAAVKAAANLQQLQPPETKG